jgi:hypothetical protein
LSVGVSLTLTTSNSKVLKEWIAAEIRDFIADYQQKNYTDII